MSGRATRDPVRGDRTRGDHAKRRAQLPLLDRLIDEAPDQATDPQMSAAEAMLALRLSVRRDLEALLNARRRWRTWPAHLTELAMSPVGYGLPDFTAGAFNEKGRREVLRVDIETTIRRFEPRLESVRVTLLDAADKLDATLRLRIDGVLHAEPAPEPVAFDTVVDTSTDEISVRPRDDV